MGPEESSASRAVQGELHRRDVLIVGISMWNVKVRGQARPKCRMSGCNRDQPLSPRRALARASILQASSREPSRSKRIARSQPSRSRLRLRLQREGYCLVDSFEPKELESLANLVGYILVVFFVSRRQHQPLDPGRMSGDDLLLDTPDRQHKTT